MLFVLAIISLALVAISPFSTPLIQAQYQPTKSLSIRFITPYEQPPLAIRHREATQGYVAPFCADNDQQKPFLTAVIPETGLGLTLAESPPFFVYIPAFSSRIRNSDKLELKGELIVSGQDEEVISRTISPITDVSGIASFRQSATASPLLIGKNYHWYFLISCDEDFDNNIRFVHGWVKRISLDSSLAHQIEKASPIQRVALYAKHGIWHETLETLLELRRAQPDDAVLAAAWEEVLKGVKLEPLTKEPVVEGMVEGVAKPVE